jgi:hypothetical protein
MFVNLDVRDFEFLYLSVLIQLYRYFVTAFDKSRGDNVLTSLPLDGF